MLDHLAPPTQPPIDFPPEYAGSRVQSTRTARDVFQTTAEINAHIEHKVKEAIKKEEVKRVGQVKMFFLRLLVLFTLSPIVTYIEYQIFLAFTSK